MKGFYVYITPKEYDGYQELCDAVNVALSDGLVSNESAELMDKFTKKMSDTRYRQT